MTPSKQCKAAGLTSLAELSEITGKAISTLRYWHSHDQTLFQIVLLGAVVYRATNTTL